MLPVINLDDENFQDIFEEARKMISGAYPIWTDYNEHDPGITFLELFSWFKEMQQYHLNQIGKDNLLNFLKLLGMKQCRKEAAQALVTFTNVSKDFRLPRGSKLLAGDICFETFTEESLESISILECTSRGKSREATVEEGVLQSGSYMRFYMFGEHPEKEDEFLIKFNEPFETGKVHSIYFKIFEEYPVKRNAIEEDNFIPLAKLSIEYYYADEWHQCEAVKDDTYQFIQSGKLYFTPKHEMQKLEDGYWIKIKIKNCKYDIPPVLQEIATNVMKVKQKDTVAEYEDYILEKNEEKEYQIILDSYLALNGMQEVYIREEQGFVRLFDYRLEREEDHAYLRLTNLFEDRAEEKVILRVVNYTEDFGYRRMYETDGFPYQKLELEDNEILYDSLEIFVENEMNNRYYEQWEKVDNFSCSTAIDCHYVFDDVNGIIYFGNCENGKAPEGNVIIIGYANSIGVRGNVKAKQINRVVNGQEDIKVTNKDNAGGGSDKESIDACFKRFAKEFRQVKRAITNNDYEQVIRNTPGLMILNVKAVPVSLMKKRDGSIDENCVSVVVQQYTGGQKTALSEAYLENIYQLLNKKRLIGTKINILSPEYIGITIFGEIIVKPHYLNAKDTVKVAVEKYFEESGSIFGKPVLFSEIYGIIDVLDCVSQVQNLSINSQGRGITRSMNGDLLLPVNGLVYLKDAEYFITSVE